jgi:hypothetical protein
MSPLLLTCALCVANAPPSHFATVADTLPEQSQSQSENPSQNSNDDQKPSLEDSPNADKHAGMPKAHGEHAGDEESHRQTMAVVRNVALISATTLSLAGVAVIGQVRSLGIGRLYLDMGAELLCGAAGWGLVALTSFLLLVAAHANASDAEVNTVVVIMVLVTLLAGQAGVALAEHLGGHDFNPVALGGGASGMLVGGMSVGALLNIDKGPRTGESLGEAIFAICGPLLVASLGINGFALLAHR